MIAFVKSILPGLFFLFASGVVGFASGVGGFIYWYGSHDTEHKYMSQTDKEMADDINEVKSDVKELIFRITFESKLVKLDPDSEKLLNDMGAPNSFTLKVITSNAIDQWKTVDRAMIDKLKKSSNPQFASYQLIDVREIYEADQLAGMGVSKDVSNEPSVLKYLPYLETISMKGVNPILLDGLEKKSDEELLNFKLVEPKFWTSLNNAIEYNPNWQSKLKLKGVKSVWVAVSPYGVDMYRPQTD